RRRALLSTRDSGAACARTFATVHESTSRADEILLVRVWRSERRALLDRAHRLHGRRWFRNLFRARTLPENVGRPDGCGPADGHRGLRTGRAEHFAPRSWHGALRPRNR